MAIPLLVAACGDDDSGDGAASGGSSQSGGKGGSTGGASPAGGTTGGTSKGGGGGSGGVSTGGSTPSGGASTGGSTPSGGSAGAEGGVAGGAGDAGAGGIAVGSGGAGNGGAGVGGVGGWVTGDGGDPAGGYGGTTGGGGGAETGGVGGDAPGGAGGSVSITPDSLDNGIFEETLTGGVQPPRGSVPRWTVTPAVIGTDIAAFIEWHAAGTGATGGTGTYHLQNWLATAYTVTTAQVVDPLPDGNYTFSVYVRAKQAAFASQYLFARGYSAADTNLELKTDITAANSNASTYTLISVGPIPVTSGHCEVGIYSDGAADAWASFDDATLTKN